MATPVWPTTLKLPLRYGLEQEFAPEAAKAITQFDGGGKLSRLRYPNAPMYLTLTLVYNDDQIEEFLKFYMEELVSGTRSFLANVLVATRVEQHRCRFENTSIKPQAVDYNRWQVPVVIEVREITFLDELVFWFLGTWGDTGEHMIDVLQYEVNEHYPDMTEDVS